MGLIDILDYNGKFTCHGAAFLAMFSLVRQVCKTNANGFSLCSSVYWPLRTLISAFDLAEITISYQSFLGPHGIPTKEVCISQMVNIGQWTMDFTIIASGALPYPSEKKISDLTHGMTEVCRSSKHTESCVTLPVTNGHHRDSCVAKLVHRHLTESAGHDCDGE